MTVRCSWCGGFGHTDRHCESGVKLRKISLADAYFRHFITRTKTEIDRYNAGPAIVLGKRPRPQANIADMVVVQAQRARR